jgi:hypothetical protein
MEPLSVSVQDGEIVVIGKITGDFPGSPITLQHAFRVTGHKVVALEIR